MLPHPPDDEQYDVAEAAPPIVPEIPVQGTVELDLDDLAHAWRRSPDGLVVRIRLGRERWISASQLERVAWATYGAGAVEVTGTDPLSVAEAVAFLHRRHAEWAHAEKETDAWLAAREAAR